LQWNLFWATGNAPDGYLEEYMPDWFSNACQYLDKDMVMEQISYNGKLYIMSYIGPSYPYIMAIRQDWLDNLGITKLPENPDEMFEILKRFTFDDPDKNYI
jgi:putative aldouronate transport system substrate-binding protein